MPVIIDKENEEMWIDPDLPVEKTLSFLNPFDEKLMFAEEVDKVLFKRTKPDDTESTLF
jgi:putative SOS response-associated peptidase YedK